MIAIYDIYDLYDCAYELLLDSETLFVDNILFNKVKSHLEKQANTIWQSVSKKQHVSKSINVSSSKNFLKILSEYRRKFSSKSITK